ncbi:hypothetical protein BPAE_0218g00210 [Botrytis paeoniae]|uniref:Uncharacterized protein n=1 Tax=Botrytis paeoniae TaxID=278948 RepID=A0A4Z1FDR7_9HELO|nr:hypothetical protein BPAE_0218g00210 [Botrytis paeoniae]
MWTFNQNYSQKREGNVIDAGEKETLSTQERRKRYRRRREGSQCVMGTANVMIHELHQVREERGGVLKRQKTLNGAQTEEWKELRRLKLKILNAPALLIFYQPDRKNGTNFSKH